MKVFEIDVKRMIDDIKECGDCDKCYVEQIWRDIGKRGKGHCSSTKSALYEVLYAAISVHRVADGDLPDKDSYVCIKRKDGKRICAKLFYDEEGKPCMFYDDFDNWYSINDVESWRLISINDAGKLTIKVEE